MPRLLVRPLLSLLLILLLAGATGCGQKGPLYREAPGEEASSPPADEADPERSERNSLAD